MCCVSRPGLKCFVFFFLAICLQQDAAENWTRDLMLLFISAYHYRLSIELINVSGYTLANNVWEAQEQRLPAKHARLAPAPPALPLTQKKKKLQQEGIRKSYLGYVREDIYSLQFNRAENLGIWEVFVGKEKDALLNRLHLSLRKQYARIALSTHKL